MLYIRFKKHQFQLSKHEKTHSILLSLTRHSRITISFQFLSYIPLSLFYFPLSYPLLLLTPSSATSLKPHEGSIGTSRRASILATNASANDPRTTPSTLQVHCWFKSGLSARETETVVSGHKAWSSRRCRKFGAECAAARTATRFRSDLVPSLSRVAVCLAALITGERAPSTERTMKLSRGELPREPVDTAYAGLPVICSEIS